MLAKISIYVEGIVYCHSEWSYRDKEWVERFPHSGGSKTTRIEFHKHGGPDVLNAVEFTPTAPGENEVQVENKAIGINYIDT